MISTTFNSTAILLLEDAPDWSSGFRADVELLSSLTSGLSRRETRTPHAASLRFKLRYTIVNSGAAARTLLGGFRSYVNQPVAVPFWPAQTTWADRAGSPFAASGLFLVWNSDWTDWEIYAAGDEPVDRAPDDSVAPLLWGRLEKREPAWLSGDALELAVEFTESSEAAYALAVEAVSWTAGPQPTAYAAAPKLFPFSINFQEAQRAAFDVRIGREEIGFGRQAAEATWQTVPIRAQETLHTLGSGSDLAALLRFFCDHASGQVFWTTPGLPAATLTAAIAAGETHFHAADVGALAANDYLLFGGTSFAKVSTLSTLTVNLASAPGAFGLQTIISHLWLARFDQPTLSLQYFTPEIGEAKISAVEVPAEIVPATGETLGSTLGLLPTACYLYEFSWTLEATTFYERATSYESDLTYGGQTYYARKISHGAITQGIALDQDAVELTTDTLSAPLWTTNPIVAMATLRMEAPVFLKILRGAVSAGAATSVQTLFNGEVTKPERRGKLRRARAVPGGSIFDQQFPAFRLQPGCNHTLFSTGCGLAASGWKFSAAIDDPGEGGYPFGFVLKTLAGVGASAIAALSASAVFENFFALGYLTFATGATFQSRWIVASTEPVAGAITITLDRDPDPFPLEDDVVYLYPGCDGRRQTCQAYNVTTNPAGKFNDYPNFGGHPFMPVGNPTFVRVKNPSGGGKK